MAVENPVGCAGAPLPIADAYTASGVRFPAGAQTRSIDCDGRIRVVAGSGGLAELLGWDTGALDTIGVKGWLVLTQRPD